MSNKGGELFLWFTQEMRGKGVLFTDIVELQLA
jgi:hypothetical protein